MASRYFFVLCALALIAGIAAAPVEEVEVESVEVDEDVERFWQGIAIWAAGVRVFILLYSNQCSFFITELTDEKL